MAPAGCTAWKLRTGLAVIILSVYIVLVYGTEESTAPTPHVARRIRRTTSARKSPSSTKAPQPDKGENISTESNSSSPSRHATPKHLSLRSQPSAKVRKAQTAVAGPNKNGWLTGTQYYERIKTFKEEPDFHVYLAMYKPLQRECVVKRQSTEIPKSMQDSVEDELRVARRTLQHRLNDEHIVEIYVYFEEAESATHRNYLYIVMEYLRAFPQISPFYRADIDNPFLSQGDSLAQVLQRGPLRLGIVRHFARQIVAGVIALKRLGVQHDDIYAKNIVLSVKREVSPTSVDDAEYVDMHRLARVVLIDFGKVKIDNVPRSLNFINDAMPNSLRMEMGNLFHYMVTGKFSNISHPTRSCRMMIKRNSPPLSVEETMEIRDALNFVCFVLGVSEKAPTLAALRDHPWLTAEEREEL